MRKERCKDGKKYLLITRAFSCGRIGVFQDVIWGDNIKDFRDIDLKDVTAGAAMLLKSVDGNVVRINRNGTKYYR